MSFDRHRLVLLPLALILVGDFAPAGDPLGSEHRKWLETEVAYIISSRERDEFLELETRQEREEFIRRFWEIRDPDLSTEVNEYRLEHYRRIEYANQRFHDGVPGWKTDRGRIHIMHGPPDDISYAFGSDSLPIDIVNPTAVLAQGQQLDRRRTFRVDFVRPETEIWVYRRLDGARAFTGYFEVIFSRTDPQELYYLNQLMRKIGDVQNASYPIRVQRDTAVLRYRDSQRIGGAYRVLYAGDYRFPDIDSFYRAIFHPKRSTRFDMADLQMGLRDLERSPGDVLEEKLRRKRRLKEKVEARVAFESFDVDLYFGSVRAQSGGTLLPVTLGIDRSLGGDVMDLLLELVRSDGSSAASLVDSFKLQADARAESGPFLYQARLAARPGRYTLRIYGYLKQGGAITYSERRIELPDYSGREMTMSDVLLFDEVLGLPEGRSRGQSRFVGGSRPLHLKDYVLIPAVDSLFRRRERLTAFFEVYNPGIASGGKQPELDVQCRLWKGDNLVAALPQAKLDYANEEEGIGGGVRRTAYGLSIPLQRLRRGKYKLELQVYDPVRGQRVSRRAPFQIY